MKKIFIILLSLLLLCSLMTSCAERDEQKRKNYEVSENIHLVEVYKSKYSAQPYSILVHKETGVMYIINSNGKYGGGISVMLDENGKPLIFEEYEK